MHGTHLDVLSFYFQFLLGTAVFLAYFFACRFTVYLLIALVLTQSTIKLIYSILYKPNENEWVR